jgi:uncharacterized protein YcbX
MTTDLSAGTVAGLWRFPVKSMRGERLQQADLTDRGLLGDRAYALVDKETGKIVSAKSVRLFPRILGCQAVFVEPPRLGHALPPVRITLFDGTTLTSDVGNADRLLSACFKREVTLVSAAPADFTIDQYHPDVENVDPSGHRDTVVPQKLGAALFSELGAPSPVPEGALFDLFPVSLLTTSTLAQLNLREPQSRFDERRFRMNVIIGAAAPGFPENEWVGQQVGIGSTARVQVAMPDPRCVMTTLAQEDLPADTGILKALVAHNRLPLTGGALYPCAGAYAVVAAPGTIRTGDRVQLGV